MRGLRQAALLVRPTVRSLSWAPLAAAGALAFGLLGLTDQGLTELRLAAIGICVGAAFILDDAAAATVASAPTPLLVRRALRVGLASAPLAALWALLSWLAGGAASWAVSLELAAMLALTLAAAAVATRLRGAGRGGAAAGPALLVLLSAAYLLLPSRWGPLPRRPTGSALDGGTSTLGPDPARRRARHPLGRPRPRRAPFGRLGPSPALASSRRAPFPRRRPNSRRTHIARLDGGVQQPYQFTRSAPPGA